MGFLPWKQVSLKYYPSKLPNRQPFLGSGQGTLAQLLHINPLIFQDKVYSSPEIYSFVRFVLNLDRNDLNMSLTRLFNSQVFSSDSCTSGSHQQPGCFRRFFTRTSKTRICTQTDTSRPGACFLRPHMAQSGFMARR
jgi:hypothetical protein